MADHLQDEHATSPAPDADNSDDRMDDSNGSSVDGETYTGPMPSSSTTTGQAEASTAPPADPLQNIHAVNSAPGADDSYDQMSDLDDENVFGETHTGPLNDQIVPAGSPSTGQAAAAAAAVAPNNTGPLHGNRSDDSDNDADDSEDSEDDLIFESNCKDACESRYNEQRRKVAKLKRRARQVRGRLNRQKVEHENKIHEIQAGHAQNLATLHPRIRTLEKENQNLRKVITDVNRTAQRYREELESYEQDGKAKISKRRTKAVSEDTLRLDDCAAVRRS